MSADRRLSIILVGQTITGSRTPQRVAALQRLGHQVRVVPINRDGATYEDRPSLMDRLRYRLRLPADSAGCNRRVVAEAAQGADLVWIEAAPMIRAGTLRRLRRLLPSAPLVWFGEDDMLNPVHRSRWLDRAIKLFDVWVTTKSFNAAPEELPALGARRVMFVHNSFDPVLHRPVPPDPALAADIAFVGTYEEPRARSLLRLAEAGLPVRVWGNGWGGLVGRHPSLIVENRPLYDEDYARVVSSTQISLGFLRKGNRDRQTCRTLEIPACGGFLLHEYSDEAAGLLEPGREAAFFRDDDELIAQARAWLADAPRRHAAAAAGLARIHLDCHSHDQRLHAILSRIFPDCPAL